ncbi:TIGR03086 family metal-binding protein [Actinomycetota bacterium Odt1-20B]
MTEATPTAKMFDLAPQARLMARIAESVADDRLDAPTPCSEFRVDRLLAHVVHLSRAFQDVARKNLGPVTEGAPGSDIPELPDDWRTRLPGHLDGLVEAWRDPAAWAGETQAGGFTMPGAVAATVVLDELLLHGWDLARATGQEYAPAPADVETCHGLIGTFAELPPGEGPFGPPVAVPDDAPLLDRVLGLSGRDPRWTP